MPSEKTSLSKWGALSVRNAGLKLSLRRAALVYPHADGEIGKGGT